MAFAGLKKQFNKCNQYVTEKIGGVEGTKLDIDFMEMERKTDITNELVDELQIKTKEFLQPNPTARAKMAAVKGISKLSGQAKSNTYPQPEGILGDCMLTYGRKLGDDSIFGTSLIEMGDSLKQMADVKYALDDNIKQNFLEPLHHLQTKDLKEVMHHRKKLQGRRLDFDCKKRRHAKGSNVTDEEVKLAEDKFAESLQLANVGMINLLENEVEQVSQLATFAESLLDYHQQSAEMLKLLVEVMQEKKEEAIRRPKLSYTPKPIEELISSDGADSIHSIFNGAGSVYQSSSSSTVFQDNNKAAKTGQNSATTSPTKQQQQVPANVYSSGSNQTIQAQPIPQRPPPSQLPSSKIPHCTAIYDFEPENAGELGFKENDIIQLISRIDENWFEGSLRGRTGYFPVSYVEVNIPLP